MPRGGAGPDEMVVAWTGIEMAGVLHTWTS